MRDKKEPSDKLWEAATRDVRPLRGKKRAPAKKQDGAITIRETCGITKTSVPAKPAKGIDGCTDEKLRRGKFAIEGRIDLHGMRQNEAKVQLARFLTRCHGAGKRCVLVITGKGKPDEGRDWWEGRPGVLRDAVPGWLAEKPLSDIVLKAHPAQAKDGGAGAMYVLLRRKRA